MSEAHSSSPSGDNARPLDHPGEPLVPPRIEGEQEAGAALPDPQTAMSGGPDGEDGAEDGPLPSVTGVHTFAEQLRSLEARVADVAEQTRWIQGVLEDRAAFDRARESAIDKMYAELQVYKQKGIGYAKKEVLLNLLLLYDHIEECLSQANADSNVHKAVDWLRDILLETLYREDVAPMEFEDDRIRRERHKIVRSVATEDPALDHTVARVTRRGFLWHEAVLRPEHVVARRYHDDRSPEIGPPASA